MEGFASELLKRVMCRIIKGIKGGCYLPSNEKNKENRIRNTEKNTSNKQKDSKQHKLHRNWNRKMNQSIANLICKALQWNNCSSLQPS